MEDCEREEVEQYLPMATEWLQRNAITRHLYYGDKQVMDRAWDLAAMLRLAHIRGAAVRKDPWDQGPSCPAWD